MENLLNGIDGAAGKMAAFMILARRIVSGTSGTMGQAWRRVTLNARRAGRSRLFPAAGA